MLIKKKYLKKIWIDGLEIRIRYEQQQGHGSIFILVLPNFTVAWLICLNQPN